MVRKSFFKERTVAEIRELNLKNIYIQRNLVDKIKDLDPSINGLELRTMIIPGKFFIGVNNSAEASRKCYKHGDLISLSQPETQSDAYKCPDIPLAIRARDFTKNLDQRREEEINFIGYSFKPVQGRDRRKRRILFVWPIEGVRVFSYSENMTASIEIMPYADSERVEIEGANIICTVPSRTKKKPRYDIRLENVPVIGNTERRAIIWSLKSNFEIDPEHRLWNMRYTWAHDREGSDVFTFYPHDIAAYVAVAGHFWKKHNLTPMEMNPFALPSRLEAEFYKKLCNNIIIYDPTLSGKEKYRKLHLAEKCILVARSIKTFGHEESMYWDPARDRKLKDYNWEI